MKSLIESAAGAKIDYIAIADGDDLTVADLVEGDPAQLSQEELRKIKQVAINEPLLVRRLINDDATTTGINVTFTFPEKSPFEVPNTVAKTRELLDKFKAKYPDIEMRASGIAYMNNAFSESSQKDLATLVPVMYGVLLLVMIILLRSFSATLATLFVIAFSAATAMGVAGWLGIKLTPPSSTAPTVILTLAIADSIHIIISMMKEMQKHGRSRNEAIVESMRINLQPVFLTSVTTAIGFLSLNFSDAPPFRDLGNITATGVSFAFLYSVTFLPAILSFCPANCKTRADDGKHTHLNRWADFVINNHRKLLLLSVIVVSGLAVMIPKLELNDHFVHYFDHSIAFRGDTEFMTANLTGIYTLELSVKARDAQGINDPEYLNNLEKFAQWLRKQPEVIHVYSMTDIFKRLNKNLHGDNPDWYRIPENREMAAQYLLLYEFSLPYGLDLNDRVNVDKSATRLTVTIKDMNTSRIRELKDRIEQWEQETLPEYMRAEVTSPVIMFSYISERNIKSMTRGNILALVLISAIILIALRSVKIGLFSLVPNLAPAVMAFGIWATLIGEINMAVAIVAAVSLGIIVDDTVHFLSKYYRARSEKGLDTENAVRYAFSTVGTALIVTTVILVAGFSILASSAFEINKVLGLMTAITIACALLADFVLLPAMLIALDKDENKEKLR